MTNFKYPWLNRSKSQLLESNKPTLPREISSLIEDMITMCTTFKAGWQKLDKAGKIFGTTVFTAEGGDHYLYYGLIPQLQGYLVVGVYVLIYPPNLTSSSTKVSFLFSTWWTRNTDTESVLLNVSGKFSQRVFDSGNVKTIEISSGTVKQAVLSELKDWLTDNCKAIHRPSKKIPSLSSLIAGTRSFLFEQTFTKSIGYRNLSIKISRIELSHISVDKKKLTAQVKIKNRNKTVVEGSLVASCRGSTKPNSSTVIVSATISNYLPDVIIAENMIRIQPPITIGTIVDSVENDKCTNAHDVLNIMASRFLQLVSTFYARTASGLVDRRTLKKLEQSYETIINSIPESSRDYIGVTVNSAAVLLMGCHTIKNPVKDSYPDSGVLFLTNLKRLLDKRRLPYVYVDSGSGCFRLALLPTRDELLDLIDKKVTLPKLMKPRVAKLFEDAANLTLGGKLA